MNVNYDKELENLISKINPTTPPRLLLHACCAPCSTYCLTQLLQYFDITLYYANDNITDRAEWEKRLHELNKLVDIVNSDGFVVPKIRTLKLVAQPFDSGCAF